MSQTDEDIPKVITNNVKEFTSNFASVLFGSMFFMSVISMFALIVTVCVILVRGGNWRYKWNSHLFCGLYFLHFDSIT